MTQKTKTLPLGTIVAFKSGGTPAKSRPDYWDGDLPWVSAKDLKSPIITDSLDHLTAIGFADANIAPEKSLLILVRGMTLHKDVPVCFAGRDLAFNQDIKALVVSQGIDPKYLLFYLLSQKHKLLELVDSAGHGTGRLDTDLLKNFPVLLPPLSDQIAIADLLTTWDTAIEKTERLIAAKEKNFQILILGLFEQNSGKWHQFFLRDICEAVTRKNTVGEVNVLTISAQHGLVSQLEYYNKSVSAEDVSGYYLVKQGEFAYNRSSSGGYPYGAIKRLDASRQGVVSTLYLCFAIKPKAPCDSDFLAHAFEAGVLNRQLSSVCQEGARSHGLLNITKTDFFDLQISLPTLTEQQRIAGILSSARQEIDLLKKQAEAYRKQKRGLMQKLLTGEWRIKSTSTMETEACSC